MDSVIIDRLRLVDRRLRWQRSFAMASMGLSAGLGLSAAVTAASRLMPLLSLEQQVIADAALVFAAVFLSATLTFIRGYKLLEVAKTVDRRAGLKERLSTAIELAEKGTSSPLAAAQREDAERAAASVNPKLVTPFSISRRLSLLAVSLLAVLVALTVLPNPMHALLEDRAATAKAIKEERAKIEQVKKETLENSQARPTEKREELLRTIEQLDKELAEPSLSKEEALSKISAAEEKLAKLLDRNMPSERLGLEQLAEGLRSMSKIDPSLQAGASSGPKQLGEDVSQLAEKLDSMNPSARSDAADALSSMAGALSGSNPSLATQLAKAADALKSGDNARAQDALGRMASELGEMDQRLSDQRAAERALSQLQASRGAIAGSGSAQGGTFVQSTQDASNVNTAGGAQGGQPGGQGQGNSGGQNSSSSGGQGSGSSPNQGTGSGAPSGSGAVAGTNAPSSPGATSSSTGQPATGRPGTTGTGSYEPVYTPGGVDSEGRPLFLPSGPDDGDKESKWITTQPGMGNSVVPYDQVFGSYSAAAARSLDSTYIPVNLKEYIRGYFTALEPAAKD